MIRLGEKKGNSVSMRPNPEIELQKGSSALSGDLRKIGKSV
jgi:hypothetical protein